VSSHLDLISAILHHSGDGKKNKDKNMKGKDVSWIVRYMALDFYVTR